MVNEITPLTEDFSTALLSGVILSINKQKAPKNNFVPFFKIKHEDVYLWRPEDNQNQYYLIVIIDKKVREKVFWKTLTTILEFTLANHNCFENISDCDYHWIKKFDPNCERDDIKFIGDIDRDNYYNFSSRFSGTGMTVEFIHRYSPFIELLIRDETFYLVWMNLFSAFRNHHFCIICAYEKEGYRDHPNHEINIWQRAQATPAMEIGILQSTRAVETILGKPGNRSVQRKFNRVLSRWKESVEINPYDEFFVAGMKYIDYYYEMFDIRGDAAHGLSKLPYDLRRKKVIEAQCFAFEIMRSYYGLNRKTKHEATFALNLSRELLK